MARHSRKEQSKFRTLLAILLALSIGGSFLSPSLAARNTGTINFTGTEFSSGLNEVARHVGKFQASTDASGYDSSGDITLEIVRPEGATGVEAAYLTSLSSLDDGSYDPPTTTLAGQSVTYSYRTDYGGYANHLADVTSIVSTYLATASVSNANYTSPFSGETDSDLLSISATLETSATSSYGGAALRDYQGLLLTVVFEDPTQTFDSTVAVMFGNADSGGQETTFSFDTLGSNAPAKSWMAVGVAWSANGAGEVSTIEASTNQLTRPDCTASPSSAGCITETAGRYDDGIISPYYQLITYGGVGDDRSNGFGTVTVTTDDELYNLDSLLTSGTSEVTLYSANASANDNFGMLTVFLPLSSSPAVTFSSGGGSGTMASQPSSSATALNSNTFTRTGYDFAGWLDGAGNSYADGATYSFSTSTTMTAQWTLASTPAPAPYTGPLPVKLDTVCVPSTGGNATLSGQRLSGITSATVDGKAITVSDATATSVKLAFPALEAGTYDVTYTSSSGNVTHQDSLRVCATGSSETEVDPGATPERFYVYKRFSNYRGDIGSVVGSDRAAITAFVNANPGLTYVTCLGSTSGTPAIASDEALALARAKNACSIVEELVPGVTTRLATITGAGKGQFFRAVTLFGRGIN